MPNRLFSPLGLADANILLASQIFAFQLAYANYIPFRRVIPMMNKRLVNTVPESKKYIAANVAFQRLRQVRPGFPPHGQKHRLCRKPHPGGIPLEEISQESLLKAVTCIGHQSYLFKGTVRKNLAMACPEATEAEMWQVLEQVKLADFLRQEQGLDTLLQERGANLSGGQCQRPALARGLLHDSPIYIFDEATSNIDADSENHIVSLIQALAGKKTVIMISHRLASIREADNICVLAKGRVAESGTHQMLLAQKGVYARLYTAQQELETYAQGGVAL